MSIFLMVMCDNLMVWNANKYWVWRLGATSVPLPVMYLFVLFYLSSNLM